VARSLPTAAMVSGCFTNCLCAVISPRNTSMRSSHLQADVGLRREETGGELQVGLAVDEVDADERLAALALVAVEALAARVCSHDNALRPVQALVVVTLAGARKDHRGRELAEKPAATHTHTHIKYEFHSQCVYMMV